METVESNFSDFLSDSTEEEFGGGGELSTTGFLIFGLITFWIYTVWRYHCLIKKHIELRSKYFIEVLESNNFSSGDEERVDSIKQKSFEIKNYPKYTSLTLYLLSMTIVLFIYITNVFWLDTSLMGIDNHLYNKITMVSICVAALFFCTSSVYFLSWVCFTLKKHEFNELLCAKFVKDHNVFKMARPSIKFIKRWNRKQNQIALFLIISIPLCISPVFAVMHFNTLIDSGQILGGVLYFWFFILFASAAVFHFWGTKILIDMYNGHLRIETVNRQYLYGNVKWISDHTNSVVVDDRVKEENGKTGSVIPQRALSAIMLTDMVGFSKEMEVDENATYDKLVTHNEIIRKCIHEYNGQEIKTIGDAFLVRFNSAVDSVKAAVTIQNKLYEYNETKEPIENILIRIGIHVGDILLMDNDVFGNGVNIVARIEPLADPGGICISADVYNAVKKSIEIKAVNLGCLELKNIKDAPEIFKILIEAVE